MQAHGSPKIATRVVTRDSIKYDHVTSVLNDPHWRPSGNGYDFKVVLLTFKFI